MLLAVGSARHRPRGTPSYRTHHDDGKSPHLANPVVPGRVGPLNIGKVTGDTTEQNLTFNYIHLNLKSHAWGELRWTARLPKNFVRLIRSQTFLRKWLKSCFPPTAAARAVGAIYF